MLSTIFYTHRYSVQFVTVDTLTRLAKLMRLLKFSTAVAVVLISGCTSVGMQYKSPAKDEGVSSLLPSSSGIFIVNFNDDGCYRGRTDVSKGTNLRPDQEVVLSVESHVRSNEFCRVVFGFTPQVGAKYTHTFDLRRSNRAKPNASGSTEGYPVCAITVLQVMKDGSQTPVPVRSLHLRQRGLACIRAEPILR
jgi:hypothetical protein